MAAWHSTGPAPCLGRRGTGWHCGTASQVTTAGAAPTACCQCCCSSKVGTCDSGEMVLQCCCWHWGWSYSMPLWVLLPDNNPGSSNPPACSSFFVAVIVSAYNYGKQNLVAQLLWVPLIALASPASMRHISGMHVMHTGCTSTGKKPLLPSLSSDRQPSPLLLFLLVLCCCCCCPSLPSFPQCSSLMRTCAMPVRAPPPSRPSQQPRPSPAHTAHTREPHQPKPTPHSLHSSSWQQQPACVVR